MDKQKLKELIDKNLSQRQIADILGCSQGKIRYWLAKFNLKTHKNIGKPNKCKFCGKEVKRRKVCPTCHSTLKRITNKIRAVKYKGGKCELCGWEGTEEQIAGFEFHHHNGDKEFQLSNFWHYGWNKVKPELDKCQMLCSICHRILHNKHINSEIAKEALKRAEKAITES